jgi:hypothetical protein
MALYYLSENLIKTEKNARRGYSNMLSMQGWGMLKLQFADWFKRIKYTYKKDLIFVAHEREDKDDDRVTVRPDIPGGTQSEILRMVDYAGYIFLSDKNKRVIDFNTTPRYLGKNPGLAISTGPVVIPNFENNTNFLAELIMMMKNRLNEMNARQAASLSKIEQLFQSILAINNASELNKLYTELQNDHLQLTESEKKQIWAKVKEHALNLNCIWEAIPKRFVQMTAAEPKTAPAPAANAFNFD